jgi:hypothetical protein
MKVGGNVTKYESEPRRFVNPNESRLQAIWYKRGANRKKQRRIGVKSNQQ